MLLIYSLTNTNNCNFYEKKYILLTFYASCVFSLSISASNKDEEMKALTSKMSLLSLKDNGKKTSIKNIHKFDVHELERNIEKGYSKVTSGLLGSSYVNMDTPQFIPTRKKVETVKSRNRNRNTKRNRDGSIKNFKYI